MYDSLGRAGVAQWWESSPPTNVARVRFPDPASYVGWVCCWFSPWCVLGSRGGAVVRALASHQCGLGSIPGPGVICRLSLLLVLSFMCIGEQGWCSGESTRLPLMWPGFDSRTRRHLWVEFVVGSLLDVYWGAGVVQWWERSPHISVAWVRFPDPASYVGWVCCRFSPCSERFFSGYSAFPLPSKTNISKFIFDPEFEGCRFFSCKTVRWYRR